jgi:hypothetical protein
MARTSIPGRDDINVHDSLDERVAVEHFLGKNLEEAELLFRERLGAYEDLQWMGPVAFRYYVRAALNYLESEAARGDTDSVGCFATALEFWIDHAPDALIPVARELALACEQIVADWDRFASAAAHDDERARYVALHERLDVIAEQGSQTTT